MNRRRSLAVRLSSIRISPAVSGRSVGISSTRATTAAISSSFGGGRHGFLLCMVRAA